MSGARMSDARRWIGFVDLVSDAVHHGAVAVERIHRGTAHGPLAILSRVPPLAPTVEAIDLAQDSLIRAVYASVRGVNAATAALLKAGLSVWESCTPADPPPLPLGEEELPPSGQG